MSGRNRLATATSPYLLQHADNPVHWWPWSDEAFDEAAARDVPVFLSVGYAACHWCHVMAHESFEDPQTAMLINDHFVAIKVDREERPDVDAVYMQATQAITGHGGWPMTVFLTPDRRPFYAGTYFPPAPRHGMPSFTQVAIAVAEAWRDRRADVVESAGKIVDQLANLATGAGGGADINIGAVIGNLRRSYDAAHGGFGGAPKFPPSMVLEALLRHGGDEAMIMVNQTCEAMARGGICDQLGGGFARYSVDARWVVPHFEKMLYDNALLLGVYTHWWRLTGTPLARRVVHDLMSWLLREMVTEEGGFAASLDADSLDEHGRHREGAFYAWNREQLTEALGPDDGSWAADTFSVTEQGTFEDGLSTLQLLVDPAPERLADVRARLFAFRERLADLVDDRRGDDLRPAAVAGVGADRRRTLVESALGRLAVAPHLARRPSGLCPGDPGGLRGNDPGIRAAGRRDRGAGLARTRPGTLRSGQEQVRRWRGRVFRYRRRRGAALRSAARSNRQRHSVRSECDCARSAAAQPTDRR